MFLPWCQCSEHVPSPPVALLGVMQKQEVDAELFLGLPASLCCPCQAGTSFQ